MREVYVWVSGGGGGCIFRNLQYLISIVNFSCLNSLMTVYSVEVGMNQLWLVWNIPKRKENGLWKVPSVRRGSRMWTRNLWRKECGGGAGKCDFCFENCVTYISIDTKSALSINTSGTWNKHWQLLSYDKIIIIIIYIVLSLVFSGPF